jgi:hypothetical protein
MFASYSDADVTVQFSSSDRCIGKFADEATNTSKGKTTKLPDIDEATYRNKSNLDTLELSASVSSIAWNAERISQAILLGISSMSLEDLQSDDNDSAIDIEFDLTEFEKAIKIKPLPLPDDLKQEAAIVDDLKRTIRALKRAMQTYNDKVRLFIIDVLSEDDTKRKKKRKQLFNKFKDFFGDEPTTSEHASMEDDLTFDITDVDLPQSSDGEIDETGLHGIPHASSLGDEFMTTMATGAKSMIVTEDVIDKLKDRNYLNLAALLLWGEHIQKWNDEIIPLLDKKFGDNDLKKKAQAKAQKEDYKIVQESIDAVDGAFRNLQDTVKKHQHTTAAIADFCILSRTGLDYDYAVIPELDSKGDVTNDAELLHSYSGIKALQKLVFLLNLPTVKAPITKAASLKETKQEERLDWILSSIPIGLSLAQEILQYGNITLNWNNALFLDRPVFQRQKQLFSIDITNENVPSMRFSEVCAITRSILD